MSAQPGQLQEIAVKLGSTGLPTILAYNGQHRKVTQIYEHWRIADGWWGEEVRRDYFRVETAQGVFDIYHDTIADRWYRANGLG